ncbi:peroxiredoxin family protein [Bacillus methanolicus]|uniref:Thiol:disulfide interchange protein n=1 Tax=Bacillus methanolicus (strain MGA3 / ATCC 53907) TaxID=796606 RepID=I3E9G5_BACMM|nr:TlpA disulfide reductase family protein [Bacillus methanolicus]AIE60384.1 thiol:disulfide interchange protein [Bacillus methanolicus MGA3]EIJ83136.1 alkyl hydroperoxide reductase/ Thiol specific antioxidant/ Mal allergen [Bacillus methanolicus MGA3]UQD52403.1 TlpA family protein disulfide reductase [Bacillus methanolicus]
MKKWIIALAAAILLIFIIDQTLLHDNFTKEKSLKIKKYEKIKNAEQLPEGIDVGKRTLNFTLPDRNGKKIQLSDFKGQRVLLNFWGSWCPPCQKEMPYMQKIYEKYKDKNFVIIAVNSTVTEKRKEDPIRFVENHGLTFPVLLDEKNQVTSMYEVLSYPTSFFVDSDGVIRSRVIGEMNEDFIEKEIKRLP